MTTTYRTATEIQQQLDAAAQAVRDLHAAQMNHAADDGYKMAPVIDADREARRQVWLAHRLDGTTPAQIAAAAGVPQLLVAQLVDDPDQRAAALATARVDAERYHQQVMDAIRDAALRRWFDATEGGTQEAPRGTKSSIAAAHKVERTTLDLWIREDRAAREEA